ncbi:MAG: DUF2062 domain-containing protein [Pseudomonadota bacterium]
MVYPKGGWRRAFEYVRLRLRRLPGTPEYIARGIAYGIFITFTPLFGFHIVAAALMAVVGRGSILAAMLATFFGNPVTFVPIGILALNLGYLILGQPDTISGQGISVGRKFANASLDLWQNFLAIFTDAKTDWSATLQFLQDVFLPYFVGGLIPGLIAGVLTYYLSVPVIRAYQNRRKGQLQARFTGLKDKAVAAVKRDMSQSEE